MSKEKGSVGDKKTSEISASTKIRVALTFATKTIIETYSPENRIKKGNPSPRVLLEALLGAQPLVLTALSVLLTEMEQLQATQELILRTITETQTTTVGIHQGSRLVN